MKKRVITTIMLKLLLASMMVAAFSVSPVKALVTMTTPIYISVDTTLEDDYEFIDCDGFILDADSIVLDLNGHTLTGTLSGRGVVLKGRMGVTVKNGIIKDFGIGVYLDNSDQNLIEGNVISENQKWHGIYLNHCDFNEIRENTIVENWMGIYISDSDFNEIMENEVLLNDYLGIILLGSADENLVEENIVTGNSEGITIGGSCYNDIIENKVMSNGDWGIRLYAGSNYNTIKNCAIQNNGYAYYKGCGVYIQYTIWLVRGNKIYHNTLVDNKIQALVDYGAGVNNVWDDGYPSGGNYWSDYIDVDYYCGPDQNRAGSDGILDQPYVIDANNRDNYPLVEPWSPRPADLLEEMIETIEAWNVPGGTEDSLIQKLEAAVNLLYWVGNENGAVQKLMDFIKQVEALEDKKLTLEQANYLIAEAQGIINNIEG